MTTSYRRWFAILPALLLCPLGFGESDVTPPELVSLSFSPTQVDISLAPQVIWVTARVTDDLSGLGFSAPGLSYSKAGVYVSFMSPSKSAQTGVSFSLWNLASGDAYDAVLTNAIVLPRYSETGVWSLQGVSLVDSVGNHRSMDLADLRRQGLPTQFTVTGSGDSEAPNLAELSFTPTTVDASASNQLVQFTARLKDNLSGIIGEPGQPAVAYAQATFASPSKSQHAGVGFRALDRLSGDVLDGVYSGTMVLPRFSEPGVWRFESAAVVDAASNREQVDLPEALKRGFPTELTVTGLGDTQPPRVVGFALSATNINPTFEEQSITVTMRITDDLSGILATPVAPFYSFGNASFTFASPSKGQYAAAYLNSAMRISGDELDGTYAVPIALPRYSEAGVWTLQDIQLADAAGNQTRLDLSDALALGVATEFVVEQQPALRITISGGTVVVSWDLEGESYQLETSDLGGPSGGWTSLELAPISLGTGQFVVLPADGGTRFFRLVRR